MKFRAMAGQSGRQECAVRTVETPRGPYILDYYVPLVSCLMLV